MFTLKTKIAMIKAVLTKKSPFYIQFYVTKRCHLKCKMCNIVEANADLDAFKTEHIEPMAKNLRKIGAGVILLTGGEPFLRKDIGEIVRVFKKYSLDIRLQTAGLMGRKDTISDCAKEGARDINVSLDSLDESLSDYINGIEGSWRKAIEMISFISETFPNKNMVCALGCVLSRYNLDEIEAVLEFATEIGWWLSLVPVHISSIDKPMNFRGYDEYFAFQKDDLPKLKFLLDRLKKSKKEDKALFDSDEYLDSIYHFVSTGSPNWRHKGICDTPNLYFAILPDGSFAPCCDYRLVRKVYVYEDSFPEIYFSKSFYKEIKDIARKCSGCNFGSYPEMSLSARSFSTIKERLLLQLKSQRYGLKKLSVEELLSIIEKIKSKYPVFNNDRAEMRRHSKKWPKAINIPQKLWNE